MGKKILLADDSITIQKVIELTFSDEDFEVVTVGNGRLAVEKVQDVRPDLVLCDIIMPEKDGYEVCDFIKKTPSLAHIPVLLLTGAFEPFDQDRASRVGCDGFLAKYPGHALFQALKFDLEEQHRQRLSAFIADVDRRLEAETDIDVKLSLVREAATDDGAPRQPSPFFAACRFANLRLVSRAQCVGGWMTTRLSLGIDDGE